MTAQILSSELSSLIAESKRKLPELRNAAEKSLQDLKALPTTSEAQLNTDLSRRPQFVEPFLIACTSKNSKFAGTGISCLQRLAVSSGLPKTRLKEVLDAVKECSGVGGLDIQLKALQILPSLLQNYPDDLRGTLIFTLLQTCSILQSSKTPSVSSTAAATLQQLISGIFERLAIEDVKSLEIPTVAVAEGDNGLVPVRAVAYDACRIFQDICSLTEGAKPQNVRFSPMPETTSLELIETIFMSHAEIISNHPELSHIIRSTLLPFLNKTFADKRTFPVTLRITRLMYLFIRNHLDLFPDECEEVLESFNRVLDLGEVAGWKRVLCMEVLRGVFSEPRLLLRVYAMFDEQENGKPILRTSMNGFVRLASEKPSLIGLGQQSTIPVGNYFQRDSAGDNSGDPSSLASKAEGTAGVGTAAVPGISNQWSSMRAPCIDQLDKSEPPSLPETYIYSLALSCLNNLAESLAKFILPLTVHHSGKARKRRGTVDTDTPSSQSVDSLNQITEGPKLKRTQSYKKRTVPSNPLHLDNHPAAMDIQTVAALIEECWPAILASCSTFFYASLDSDHYRALVRSYQKFAQVAGLLRMATPRDAFLTTLGKAAVPPHVLAATFASPTSQSVRSPSILDSAKELLSVESLVNQASTLLPDRGGRRASLDSGEPSLSSRNLLCLRALLNIAIALGPTLENSWSIVFETLQQADKVMASLRPLSKDSRLSGQSAQAGDGGQYQVITTEMNAVHAATSRLFESTSDFPNESFVHVLQCLCKFLGPRPVVSTETKTPPSTPGGAHRRISSFSGISVKTDTTDKDFVFALAKIRELISGNIERFINNTPADSGWEILTDTVTAVATQFDNPATGRLLAAELVCRLARDTVSSSVKVEEEERNEVQCRSLEVLFLICKGLGRAENAIARLTTDETSDEVHSMALETLRAILEQIGDVLTEGWPVIFDVMTSVFVLDLTKPSNGTGSKQLSRSRLCSVPLGRASFASVQLICSDFLTCVPDTSLLSLVDTIFRFCSQSQDVNIALTTTTLFWNLSDLLYGRTTDDALNTLAADVGSEPELVGGGLFQMLLLAAEQKSMPALWLLLLRRLTDTTADPREEVRTGALHTILRIFGNHGEDLSPDSWQLCLRAILLPLLREDVHMVATLIEESSGANADVKLAEINGRVTTSRLLLDGTSKLFATYLPQIAQCSLFTQMWEFTATTLSSYLDCHLHDISSGVYAAITTILSSVEDVEPIGMHAVQRFANIWANHFPSTGSITITSSNQEAFESYLRSFKVIYRLSQKTINVEVILKISENLEQAVVQSDLPSYSSDVDSMTIVQKGVIECLSILRTDLKGSPCIILGLLARFIGLPFESVKSEKSSRLTFVALSKASMDLLQVLAARHATRDEIFAKPLLLAVNNLEKPIALKYQWSPQGKAPALWQKATSTLLSVLEHTLTRIFDVHLDQKTINNYWEAIVKAGQGIAHADIEAASDSVPVFDDEDFDIASLSKLNSLIIPALGSNVISDTTRRAYARGLFESSLLHETEPDELPDLGLEPLKDIYTIRFGRTCTPDPSLRGMMAYHCLGDLISLVSTHDSSPQRIKLAQAASPYLILRAALPLKAYIADQPLRGRYMPQPESERQELLFVLKQMRELESESKAIPESDGVKSEGKRHLVRLYGLVVKAVEVAAGTASPDGELIGEMKGWLEGVGDEFKL